MRRVRLKGATLGPAAPAERRRRRRFQSFRDPLSPGGNDLATSVMSEAAAQRRPVRTKVRLCGDSDGQRARGDGRNFYRSVEMVYLYLL